jgi:methionyl-tRNA formyltransferase
MRIAYVGSNDFANCAVALLDEGHEITHLFSAGRSRTLMPVGIDDVALRTRLRVQSRRITQADIERAVEQGAEALFCAGYGSRLPLNGDEPFPALNMHPSPLPEGRGPAPFEWAILAERTETAVTIHQMVERFDAGPIVWQGRLPIGPHETITSLRFRARDLAEEGVRAVFRDFQRHWEGRTPQGPGTYCKVPRRTERTLRWDTPLEVLDRQIRAFAPGRRFATLAGRAVRLDDAEVWRQPHALEPGTIAGRRGREYLVATSDGYARVTLAGRNVEQRLRLLAWPAVRRIRGR